MSIKEKSSKKLDLSSAADFLIEQWLEEGFEEPIIDLKTFIESKDYLGLEPLSSIQYRFVENMTDIYKGCLYTEGVAEWGKGSVRKGVFIPVVRQKNLAPFTKDKEYSMIRVEDIESDFTCYAWDAETNSIVETEAKKPYIEGTGELYEVKLDNGQSITVTYDHRFYTPQGYKKLKEIEIGEQVLCGMFDVWEEIQTPSSTFAEKSQNIYTRISDKIWRGCRVFLSRLQRKNAFFGNNGRSGQNQEIHIERPLQKPSIQSNKETRDARQGSNSNKEKMGRDKISKYDNSSQKWYKKESNILGGEHNKKKWGVHIVQWCESTRNTRVTLCDSIRQAWNNVAKEYVSKICIYVERKIEKLCPRFLFAWEENVYRNQRRASRNGGCKSKRSDGCWSRNRSDLFRSNRENGATSRINWRRVLDISYKCVDIFYDFEVPKYHNYIAVGNLSNSCVAPETLIDTPSEPKMIGEISSAFACYAYDNKSNNIIKSKACKPLKKGIADLYEVITTSGKSIIVTLEHQFLSDGGWKKLSELKVGDNLICAYDPDDIHLDAIYSITFLRNGDYYDLSVPGYGNYLAQGFINHNSDIEGFVNHNSGKDHCCRIILARILYLLLNMKNPAEYYGLSKNSVIYTVNVSTSGTNAEDVFFDEYKQIISNSPYFKKICGGNVKITGNEIQLPKNLRSLSCNSSVESWEGYNCIAVICDEIDAFKTEDELRGSPSARAKKSAHGTYYRALAATQSRFPSAGKVIELSWPRYKNSFIQQRRKIGRTEKGTFVACQDNGDPYATWEVHPSFDRSEFETLYAKNKKLAEAMYECKPGFSEDMFFQNDKPLLQSFEARYSESDIVIESSAPRNKNNWDDILSGKYLLDGSGYFCIHVDLGYTHNKAAVGVAHKMSEIRGENNDYQSFVKVDALKCYYPEEATGEVNFQTIREDIFKIKQQGYPIWKVTMDHYMSAEFRQNLNKSRITCDLVHFDRNTEIYDTFKDIIDAGRCQGFFDAELIYEFLRLQKIFNRKVVAAGDAPKDAADAIAGAVYQASQMPINRNQFAGNLGDAYDTTPQNPDNPGTKIQNLLTLPVEKGMCSECIQKVAWFHADTPEIFLEKQYEQRPVLRCIMCYKIFNDKPQRVVK